MYWITGILGTVLAVAPFLFGYADNTAALWTSLIVGLGTLAVSLIEGTRKATENWEYYIAAMFGLIAIIAPFVFNYGGHTFAVLTNVVLGILVAIVAGSKLYVGQNNKPWMP